MIICLHKMKWIQVLQFNTNYSIEYYPFICTQLKWFQILLCITNNSIKQSFVEPQLNDQIILFLTIQFSISHLSALSLNVKQLNLTPIDRTISGVTNLGQSGPGINGNAVVLCIPQISSIYGASPSDSLVSCLGHSLEGSYLSTEMHSIFCSPRLG